jgi:hypothetical protein
MTQARNAKPKSWDELRSRVLSEGYLTDAQLRTRRRYAHYMKYALVVLPVAVVGVVLEAVQSGFSMMLTVAVALVAWGGIAAFRTGTVWEKRWTELIRDKAEGGSISKAD